MNKRFRASPAFRYLFFIALTMVLAYLAFAVSIHYAERHPYDDGVSGVSQKPEVRS